MPDSLLQEVWIKYQLWVTQSYSSFSGFTGLLKVHFPVKDSCNFQWSFQPLPEDLFSRSIVIVIIPCPLSPQSSFSPTPTSFLSKSKSSQLSLASAELLVTMDTLPSYWTNSVSMISYIYFTLTINLKRGDFNCLLPVLAFLQPAPTSYSRDISCFLM